LSGLGHTGVIIEDTVAANNEVGSGVCKTGNSSSTATITITMYAVAGESAKNLLREVIFGLLLNNLL